MSLTITNRILDTVRTRFLRQGYPGTPLRDIARSAKVTEGVIYRVFGGKIGLYQCALRHTVYRIDEVTSKLIDERGVSGVSWQEIAERVGVSSETLQLICPNFENLIEHAMGRKGA